MKKQISKVIQITLFLNIVLTIIKLGGGFIYSSPSLKSDGFNSLMDIFVSAILLVTFKIRNKAPDINHPYGHEKFEGVAYLMLGLFIILTGIIVFVTNTISVINLDETQINLTPSRFTVVIAVIALLIKGFLFFLNYNAGRKYNIPSVKADSFNHLLDLLVTSISLLGIILAQFFSYYFEYIAAMIIGIVIIIVAIKMLKEAIYYLVDTAPSEEVINTIKKVIFSIEGVIQIDDLKVRTHMNKLYVDVEIAIAEDVSFKKAHAISEAVHQAVEKEGGALHCMVHANPVKK